MVTNPNVAHSATIPTRSSTTFTTFMAVSGASGNHDATNGTPHR